MATWVIARLTFLEAIRRRILLAAFILGVAFLVLYGIGYRLMQIEATPTRLPSETALNIFRNGMYNFMVLTGLYAVNFLVIALGALVSADTLAGEISSGTIQALVTKPVRRAEIVLGKWLGFVALIGLYLILMVGGVMGIAFVSSGYALPNPHIGFALIYLEAILVMTITLMCSSMLPTLATGGVVFGLWSIAFIGGWVEQFGALMQTQSTVNVGQFGTVAHNPAAVNIGILSSLIIPSEALWRRAAYEMTPPIAQALGIQFNGPMMSVSVPSELMIGYAVVYLAIALVIAIRSFAQRDL